MIPGSTEPRRSSGHSWVWSKTKQSKNYLPRPLPRLTCHPVLAWEYEILGFRVPLESEPPTLTAKRFPHPSFPQQPQQSLFFKPRKTREGKIICGATDRGAQGRKGAITPKAQNPYCGLRNQSIVHQPSHPCSFRELLSV